jgi:hypothetical protein
MLDAKHEYEVDMERAGWQPSPPIRAAGAGSASTGAAGGSSQTPAGSGAPGATTPAPRPGDAGSASASSGGGMPPASSAPGHAGRVNPDEVTRTLASLADLRDRGAISEAEYESKKADLLSRL